MIIFNKYYISNVQVKESKPQFRVVDNQYEWVITRQTLLEEIEDNTIQTVAYYNFTPFCDLPSHMDQITSIGKVLIIFLFILYFLDNIHQIY